MACSNEHTLNLVPWLLVQIEKKIIPGLQFRNEDKSLIQIPWNHQNSGSDYEGILHRMWVERKGVKINPNSKPADVKGSFRSALNKSKHLRERKDLHQLNKQMNNYRVYQILTLEESCEIKKKAVKRHSNDGSNSTQQSPASCVSFSASPEIPPTPQQAQISEENTKFDGDFPMDLDLGDELDLDSITPTLTYSANPVENIQDSVNVNNQLQDDPSQYFADSKAGKPSVLYVGANLDDQQISNVQTSDYGLGDVGYVQTAPLDTQWDKSRSILWNYMNHCTISNLYDQLSLYTITLHYGDICVGKGQFDLVNEMRLLYGSHAEQVGLLHEHHITTPDHFLKDPLEFPLYAGSDEKIKKTLSKMGQGMLLQSDNDGNLYGTRNCGAGIFQYDQKDENEPIYMKRGEKVLLFSHQTFIDQVFAQNKTGKFPKSMRTKRLFFGFKPHTIESKGVVSMTIMPECVEEIKSTILGSDSSSLVFSENSLDNIIEKFQQMKVKSATN